MNSELDATLDHEDMIMSVRHRSHFQVHSAKDQQEFADSAGETSDDLHINAVGGATLTMIRKVDGLAVRSTFAPNPTEATTVSFYSGTTSLVRAPRDICEDDQHETGDWNRERLERCVDRLARCDQTKCQQDLLNLLVSSSLLLCCFGRQSPRCLNAKI